MWKRKELKDQAKSALKANYWRSVLIAVIMTVLVSGSAAGIRSGVVSGGLSGATVGSGLLPGYSDTFDNYIDGNSVEPKNEAEGAVDAVAQNEPADAAGAETTGETADAVDAGTVDVHNEYAYDASTDINASVEDLLKLAGVNDDQLAAIGELDEDDVFVIIMIILAALTGILLIVTVISFVINLLVIDPFKIGCYAFFMENTRTENTNISALERGFTPKYGRNVGAMFLKNLYLCFWTMLFVVPGMIKKYSYRMVPYILADDPDIGANDAITRSREMMKGNKWRAFVLDLSFIGWFILSLLTFGLVGIFYLNPYEYGTDAALYNALKGEATVAPAEV